MRERCHGSETMSGYLDTNVEGNHQRSDQFAKLITKITNQGERTTSQNHTKKLQNNPIDKVIGEQHAKKLSKQEGSSILRLLDIHYIIIRCK